MSESDLLLNALTISSLQPGTLLILIVLKYIMSIVPSAVNSLVTVQFQDVGELIIDPFDGTLLRVSKKKYLYILIINYHS